MSRGKPGRRTIFQRLWLRPAQLRTVAGRRLADAEWLARSGKNARANGAIYLGGFAVECLLKARLLLKHRWLQTAHSSERLSSEQTRLWRLCYRSHELEEILIELPEIQARIDREGRIRHRRVRESLQRLRRIDSLRPLFSSDSNDQ